MASAAGPLVGARRQGEAHGETPLDRGDRPPQVYEPFKSMSLKYEPSSSLLCTPPRRPPCIIRARPPNCTGVIDLSGRGTTREEDGHGTPTQSHISPRMLVYEDYQRLGFRMVSDQVSLVGPRLQGKAAGAPFASRQRCPPRQKSRVESKGGTSVNLSNSGKLRTAEVRMLSGFWWSTLGLRVQ